MSADPNWLLSALAQSAAALVAIIGGFLISRVIATAAERDAIRRRLATLDSQVDARQRRLSEIDKDLNWLDALDVYYEHLDRIMTGGPEVVSDILRGIPASDVLGSLLTRMAQRAQQAIDVLRPHFVDGHPPPQLDDLRRAGKLRDDIEDFFYEDAWQHIDVYEHRYSPPLEDLRVVLPSETPAVRGPTRADRRFHLEGTRDDVEHELNALRSERERQRAELESLVVPDEVRQGVWVLSYFALAGIMFPLTVQAVGVVNVAGWLRALLVIGFASGLALLLWFLWRVSTRVASAR